MVVACTWLTLVREADRRSRQVLYSPSAWRLRRACGPI